MKKPIKIHDFLPLILLFVCIITLTTIHQWYAGYSLQGTMSDFMAFFFLIFGFFKILNWHGFAQAYAEYDILAQQSKVYAYAYPLIELALGTLYFLRLYPTATNLITLVVMLISGIGVAHELLQKKQIVCACLGVVFKIPMTYVTLLEDLLMAGMALYMLLM